jgi:hypothetical protein
MENFGIRHSLFKPAEETRFAAGRMSLDNVQRRMERNE